MKYKFICFKGNSTPLGLSGLGAKKKVYETLFKRIWKDNRYEEKGGEEYEQLMVILCIQHLNE